jgi:hypothetical protein
MEFIRIDTFKTCYAASVCRKEASEVLKHQAKAEALSCPNQ